MNSESNVSAKEDTKELTSYIPENNVKDTEKETNEVPEIAKSKWKMLDEKLKDKKNGIDSEAQTTINSFWQAYKGYYRSEICNMYEKRGEEYSESMEVAYFDK